MTVGEVTSVLESFAPLGIQEKWDNSGLLIGSPDSPVHGILVGLDCTPELIDEAAACGADLVITHHPLIFGGLSHISPDDSVGLAVLKAVKAGISVYAAHTTADKAAGGVSWEMARRLGLQDVEILDPEAPGIGLGVVGNLLEPVSGEEAVRLVKERFGASVVRASKPVGRVSRIALCGGSGSSLIEKARLAGAQAYVSGDISYHHFFQGEGFMVMDIGHFESEVDIVDNLFSLLRKNFPTFAVRRSDALKNPVYYY